MRSELTTAFVESVKPPDQGQEEYWDRKVPGFGLRVSQGGTKTYVLIYRYGRVGRRLKLGTYPPMGLADARDMAKANLLDVQRGLDPAFVKRKSRDADTFAEVADRYLAEHARVHKRPASVIADESILNAELRPAWNTRKAQDIRRKDVIALVDSIAARGVPIRANRTLSLISKIFNFAVSKELIDANPAQRVPKPGKEHQKDRALNDKEVVAVWNVLDTESPEVAAMFRILLLTGQRRGEVIGMTWDEISLEEGWWILPHERVKNHRSHRVPLVGRAREILKRLAVAREDNEPFVFPGRAGHAIVNLAKPLARVIERSKVAAFTIHDLRRTAATGMARAGVTGAIISKVLNHVTAHTGASRITAIYNRHEYDNEKRQALEKWDKRLSSILRAAERKTKAA